MSAKGATAHVTLQGHTVDARTKDMFDWANKHYHKRTGHWLSVAQGCYNRGGVAASAGTHDGSSALDIGAAGMTNRQVKTAVRWLRRAGFAAWERKTIPGLWTHHIHCIALHGAGASAGARQQMQAYYNHRDGLAGNAYDPTWRPKHPRVWSFKKHKPIIKK